MQIIPLVFAAIYVVCLVLAAGNDIATMTIPNRLNLFLAGAFFPAALLLPVPMTLTDWGVHIGLGLAGLVVGMIFFSLRFMGGGDAKLIAAASLWLGFHGWVAMLIYTALAGGVLTLSLIMARKFFWTAAPKLPTWLGRHLEPRGGIPYGIAICAGGLFAVMQSDIWQKLSLHVGS